MSSFSQHAKGSLSSIEETLEFRLNTTPKGSELPLLYPCLIRAIFLLDLHVGLLGKKIQVEILQNVSWILHISDHCLVPRMQIPHHSD